MEEPWRTECGVGSGVLNGGRTPLIMRVYRVSEAEG